MDVSGHLSISLRNARQMPSMSKLANYYDAEIEDGVIYLLPDIEVSLDKENKILVVRDFGVDKPLSVRQVHSKFPQGATKLMRAYNREALEKGENVFLTVFKFNTILLFKDRPLFNLGAANSRQDLAKRVQTLRNQHQIKEMVGEWPIDEATNSQILASDFKIGEYVTHARK